MSKELIQAALAHGVCAEYAADWAERAAILQIDGGYPPAQASVLAASQLIAHIPAAAYERKIHLVGEAKSTACGARARAENIVSDHAGVTCSRCLRFMEKTHAEKT